MRADALSAAEALDTADALSAAEALDTADALSAALPPAGWPG